jgi:hypothetical protein
MFAVHVTHYYYRGTINRPDDGLLRHDNGDVMTFSSHESASNYIRLLQPGENYRLQHGEYSPPDLRVRKIRNKSNR